MNTIKTTLDFLGKHWSLSKHSDDYHFFAYDWNLNGDYHVSLYLTDKTADGIFKKIQAEINKHGFKVKKAKVTKVKRKKK